MVRKSSKANQNEVDERLFLGKITEAIHNQLVR